MKNILLINAKKALGHSGGRLNTTLHEAAVDTLNEMGLNTRQTTIDNGYQVDEELQKFAWADAIIYQMPGWWMGPPWILKKYMDEVFTAGYGLLYQNDGRSDSDPSKKYGSGGLSQNKRYMLSVTWNAPQEAFDDPRQFFEGVGVDGVYMPFHKANAFLGMSPLPTFLCTNVMKDPQVDKYLAAYRTHLQKAFAG